MSRRVKSLIPTVSLFPFLAVLLCTMGILVLMLVVAVKSAELQANDEQRQQAEKIAEQEFLEQQRLDEAELKIMGWSSIRPELVEKLRQARELRQVIEQTLLEFETELKQVVEQKQRLRESASGGIDPIQTEREIAQLEARATELETLLSQVPPAQPTATLYSIVPYEGPGGTRRRPIYVECTAAGVWLQPYQIMLGFNDFAPPLGPGNPLDAALMTIRDHWRQTDTSGEHGDPYPLLVVRSDGAPAYNLARRAMTSWVDEFGYELVDEGLELDFGSQDAELVRKLREVIARAKQEQMLRAQAVQELQRWQAMGGGGGSSDNRPSGGLTPDRIKGGFTSNDPRIAPANSQRGQSASTGLNERVAGASAPPSQNSPPAPNSPNEFNSLNGSTTPKNGQTDSGTPSSSSTDSGQPSGNQAQPSASSCSCLAEQRGSNWALPNHSDRGTAYTRPIRIVCDAQQINLISSASPDRETISLVWRDRPEQTVAELVPAVWSEMDKWGIAAANGYWKPELRIRVLPGGEQRFLDLQQLMNDSGFLIVRD